MSKPNPFDFLSPAQKKGETLSSVERGMFGSEEGVATKPNPFDFLTPETTAITFEEEERSPNLSKAFAQGAIRGVKDSFGAFGVKESLPPELVSNSERVASFLGSFAGLGLGFIPYGAATGVVLRGVGLASTISNPIVYGFVKNSLAGIAQGVGMSRNKEELASNVALGATLGVGIEALFMKRAMRARAAALATKGAKGTLEAENAAKAAISSAQLEKENALLPTAGQAPEDIVSSLRGLFSDEAEGVDNALIEKLGEKTSLKLNNPSKNAITTLLKRFPQAQVLQRGDDFFIHNPISPTNTIDDSLRLSDQQIQQWNKLGHFEGLEALHRGKSKEFTGEAAAEGYVMIREPGTKGGYAVPKEEVGIPIYPKVSTQSAVTRGKLMQILATASNKIGFTMATGDTIQHGFADVSEYMVVQNLKKALKRAIPAGTKGIVERQNGIVTGIHVLDDSTLQIDNALPNLGQSPIDYVERENYNIRRLQAGQAQGFDTRTPLYHGTGKDFENFNTQDIHLTDSPNVAEHFAERGARTGAANIRPVYARLTNPLNFKGDFISLPMAIEDAKRAGHDGLIMRGERSTQYVVFDPSNVRSQFDSFGVQPGQGEIIRTIRPSWRNVIERQLQDAGIARKDFPEYIRLAEAEMKKKVNSMLDDDTRRALAISEGIAGGCI